MTVENANPIVFSIDATASWKQSEADWDDSVNDPVSADEIFTLIKDINDPEHPLSLQQLNVVSPDLISVTNIGKITEITIFFTPTIPHCSMATLIGLSIRIQLMRSLPPAYRIVVKVSPGTHQSELQVNKQLNDKERVCAAQENMHLLSVVNQCLETTLPQPIQPTNSR